LKALENYLFLKYENYQKDKILSRKQKTEETTSKLSLMTIAQCFFCNFVFFLQASKRKARLQSAKKEEEKARLAEVEGLVDMLGRTRTSIKGQ
jgi:hypothetical protein